MCITPHPETILLPDCKIQQESVWWRRKRCIDALPRVKITTYMSIDDAYKEWYEQKFKIKFDRQMALPILRTLKGSLQTRTPMGRAL